MCAYNYHKVNLKKRSSHLYGARGGCIAVFCADYANSIHSPQPHALLSPGGVRVEFTVAFDEGEPKSTIHIMQDVVALF